MKTTGKTVNIPKLEISGQERTEHTDSHQKALKPARASYARQDWWSSRGSSHTIG